MSTGRDRATLALTSSTVADDVATTTSYVEVTDATVSGGVAIVTIIVTIIVTRVVTRIVTIVVQFVTPSIPPSLTPPYPLH
jgi:hypothetical protein